jgi:hypothetical protein
MTVVRQPEDRGPGLFPVRPMRLSKPRGSFLAGVVLVLLLAVAGVVDWWRGES